MVSEPAVSVIVPTHGRPGTLERALRSIVDQTWTDLEVVVVNDNAPGSTEDRATQESVHRVDDPRIRLIATAGDEGGGRARNIGCRHAWGEYLAFLDDDDVFLPDKVGSQLAFMREENLEMSWQDVAWFKEDGMLVEVRRLDHCADFSTPGLLRAHLLTPISPTSIYMLRKDLFDRTEGFGEVPTGQDWWLMLRCIEAGARIGYMPGVHVHQFLHGGARLSAGENKLRGEAARHEVVRSYYDRLDQRDIEWIEFRHHAVLAVAMARSGAPIRMLVALARAFRASPRHFVAEGARRALTVWRNSSAGASREGELRTGGSVLCS